MSFARARYIPAFLTVALLLGLTADTLTRPQPGDADPYHLRVKAAEAQIAAPDGWTFKDDKLPEAAIALLKPNAKLYRQFWAPHQFQLLFIQCRDARDMGGHYPPVCYPASGWVAVVDENTTDLEDKGRDMTWTVGSKTIIGKEYKFTGSQDGQTITRVVDNLLILPRGSNCYVRSMRDIRHVAADYLRQFYGAAQIQLIFDGAVPEDERREVFSELIGKNMNLLNVLESQ
jgi:hypothetical protein